MFSVIQDVFLLDTKAALFVWVGNGASLSERKNAMSYAHVSTPSHVNTHLICTSISTSLTYNISFQEEKDCC